MTKTNPTIFIVDDEPLLSEMLTDYLKEQEKLTWMLVALLTR